ncbi:MAG: spermidine synthase [Deltaproteobacteria bacterium]|nr:spermidine synthase [Deltaproteobacteria bacterium]
MAELPPSIKGHGAEPKGDPLVFFLPHMLIFASSACIMVVELVAGRLIARHLGCSLYTWTSIIGVVLAGMSVGNMVGGRLADRFTPRRILGGLFFAASVSCMVTLLLNGLFAEHSPLMGFSWPARVLGTVILVFFLPAVILGTISPATAKMALEGSEAVGRTIGSVYAWGAVGSIVGTMATGFWLIAWLGAQGVVLGTALVLGLVALLLGPRRIFLGLWLCVLVGLLALPGVPSVRAHQVADALGLKEARGEKVLFGQDSHYQFIKVYRERVVDRDHPSRSRDLRVLALDHLVHGYIDPSDPSYLHYEYERVYRDVVRAFMGERRKITAFFIGGGAYTFPRWVLAHYPGSAIDVAEIDPLVVEANYQALGLPRDTPIRTFALDARNAVDDLPTKRRYDLIFGDAFNDLSVPFHLVTLEFSRQLATHLSRRGVYLVNVIDDFSSGLLLCSFITTLQRVFPHVYVFSTSRWGVSGGRDTFVVAASWRALDEQGWETGHEGGPYGSLFSPEDRRTLMSQCKGRVLTDFDAPVENLLQPVVRKRP